MTRIAIVGGGINGLVAANYLARGGADVTLHERRAHVGGACVSEAVTVDGVDYEFPLGATVLGFMQDFVLEETGLSSRLETWAPPHPKLVHFPGVPEPVYIHRDPVWSKYSNAQRVSSLHLSKGCLNPASRSDTYSFRVRSSLPASSPRSRFEPAVRTPGGPVARHPQPRGRKTALRREIPSTLRGFQGRLSC